MPADPLADPAFKPPGLLEKFREDILGLPRPLACAQIEVTSICQGACGYCPREIQRTAWRARHMRAETFGRVWPILRRAARAHLQGWGEPLLHPRFFDFQKLAHKAGCLTSTTTSGMKMDERLARKLAGSGMDIIAFSLAGASASSNSIRRNVPFEQVRQSILILRRAIRDTGSTLEIHLAYLLLADRIADVEQLPALMDSLDVDMAVVSTLDYLPQPEMRELAITPTNASLLARARDALEKARERAEEHARFIHYSLPAQTAARHGCRENVAKNVYIDADGYLSPCVYLNVPGDDPPEKRRIFGNVNTADAWELWRAQSFRDFRQSCLSPHAPSVCLDCPKHWEAE